MEASEAKLLKQFEEKNRSHKSIVANFSLVNQILNEVILKILPLGHKFFLIGSKKRVSIFQQRLSFSHNSIFR